MHVEGVGAGVGDGVGRNEIVGDGVGRNEIVGEWDGVSVGLSDGGVAGLDEGMLVEDGALDVGVDGFSLGASDGDSEGNASPTLNTET